MPALRAAAADDDADVRRAAILALGVVAPREDAETVRTLSAALGKDRDSMCQGMAALSLGRVGGASAARSLRHAQVEGSSASRPFVVLGLGILARGSGDDAIARNLLNELTQGAQNDMTGALCVAVGLAGRPEAGDVLRKIVNETADPEVRGHAAMALGLIGDAGAPSILRPLMDVQIPQLQGEAAMALGLLADRESVVVLGEKLDHATASGSQAAAAVALGLLGGPNSTRLLSAAMKDTGKPALTRKMAAFALGKALDRTGGKSIYCVGADLNWCALTASAIGVTSEL